MTGNYAGILFIIAAFSLCGCANKVAPAGGPKDITPPELLSAIPENRTVNFSSGSIVLTFDEYIQLKDPGKQLVISPPITPAPLITVRKKSVVIEINSELSPSTTYTINFGNAIVDNNEENALRGFQYLFSTGTYIDSLKIKGKVKDALTLKPQKEATVILYEAKTADSLYLKKAPDFFSRTDESGYFEIRNIRPGNYILFALLDKNNNYILDQADETIGWYSETIELRDSAMVEVRLFKQAPAKQSVVHSSISANGKAVTVFSVGSKKLEWKIEGKQPEKLLADHSVGGDTIVFFAVPPFSDTLRIIWIENGVVIDTVEYKKPVKLSTGVTSKTRFTGYTLFPEKGGILHAETNPFIRWDIPVEVTDQNKFVITKDSVAVPFQLNITDSLNSICVFKAGWQEGTYQVMILPGAIQDIYGAYNDTVITTFTVTPERTKGSIGYKISSPGRDSGILQLLNEKDEVLRTRIYSKQTTGTFEGLLPGNYQLRVIDDQNENNRWDTGDLTAKKQPERVYYYREMITVRANWEVSVEWDQ